MAAKEISSDANVVLVMVAMVYSFGNVYINRNKMMMMMSV